MAIQFEPPTVATGTARHHVDAASGNLDVTNEAIAALDDALSGATDTQRIVLKAAAGAVAAENDF